MSAVPHNSLARSVQLASIQMAQSIQPGNSIFLTDMSQETLCMSMPQIKDRIDQKIDHILGLLGGRLPKRLRNKTICGMHENQTEPRKTGPIINVTDHHPVENAEGQLFIFHGDGSHRNSDIYDKSVFSSIASCSKIERGSSSSDQSPTKERIEGHLFRRNFDFKTEAEMTSQFQQVCELNNSGSNQSDNKNVIGEGLKTVMQSFPVDYEESNNKQSKENSELTKVSRLNQMCEGKENKRRQFVKKQFRIREDQILTERSPRQETMLSYFNQSVCPTSKETSNKQSVCSFSRYTRLAAYLPRKERPSTRNDIQCSISEKQEPCQDVYPTISGPEILQRMRRQIEEHKKKKRMRRQSANCNARISMIKRIHEKCRSQHLSAI